MTLRDLNARIRALEDAEQLRQNTETALLRKRLSRGLGVLGAWATRDDARDERAVLEAAARQLGAHRESVVWFLRTRLQETARTQQRMMETRLTREMEKNRSVLAKARSSTVPLGAHNLTTAHPGGQRSVGTASAGADFSIREEEDEKRPEMDITDDQRQLFEKGNQDMLKHLESTLDKVRCVTHGPRDRSSSSFPSPSGTNAPQPLHRTAESSLLEIAELQNMLVNNLTTQSAHIDQLVADSFETTEGIGKGNKELNKSVGRPSQARYTFFAAAGLCTALILWDLII